MVDKVVLDNVASGFDLTLINNNFQTIENELNNKVLYRDNLEGSPNELITDVDVNGKVLYNLPEPLLASQAARLQDITNATAGGAANLISATPYSHIAASNVQAYLQELTDEKTAVADLAGTDGVLLVGNATDKRDLISTAVGKGAALVGWLRSATGAVATTVATRLGWFEPCVFEFLSAAAVLDVQTDAATIDTRAAIAAADTAGPFVFYKGTYKVSSNLTITNAVEFKPGAKLSIDTGVVVTINGQVRAQKQQIFSGLGTVVLNKSTLEAYPEWWGAGHLATSAAALNKMANACETNSVPVLLSQTYLIEELVEFPYSLPVRSTASASFNAFATANCLKIKKSAFGTNATRMTLPSITAFTGYALKLAGTNLVMADLPVISNCGDAIVIETVNATHSTVLDATIRVQQIESCTNAIRFTADNNGNIIQGCEIYVNFVNACNRTVYFDAAGLSPNWDSNLVETQAIDVVNTVGAANIIHNNSAGSADRLTFICESWLGGWDTTGGGHKIINGSLSALDFRVNFANIPVDGQFALSGVSNILDVKSRQSRTEAYWITTTAANSKATFKTANGGLVPFQNRIKLKMNFATDLTAGSTRQFYFYHQLTDGFSNIFRFSPGEQSMGGLVFDFAIDQSGTNANEVTFVVRNASGATITAGTDLYCYCDVAL